MVIKVSSCVIDSQKQQDVSLAALLHPLILIFSLPQSCLLPAALHFHMSIVIKLNHTVPSQEQRARDRESKRERDVMKVRRFNSLLVSY